MLSKRLDGLWVDKLGFVAAIMFKWNCTIKGVNHYIFLATPFHTIPYDITSNEIDDSVLVSNDMYNTLIARKIARAITNEEAEEANKNEEIEEANELLAQNEVATALAIKLAAEKASTNPSAPAKPVPVKVADPVTPTSEQAKLIASVTATDAIVKKGK